MVPIIHDSLVGFFLLLLQLLLLLFILHSFLGDSHVEVLHREPVVLELLLVHLLELLKVPSSQAFLLPDLVQESVELLIPFGYGLLLD